MMGIGRLRCRLAVVALATTAVWVAVLTLAFNLVLGWRLGQQADGVLSTRAAAVAATVAVRADGGLAVHEPPNDEVLDVGVWIYRGNVAVERPTASSTMQAAADRLAGHPAASTDVADQDPWRLYAQPVTAGGRQVGTIVTAVGLGPYQGVARSALAASIGLALLLLGGVYLVTRLVVGRALRPVAAVLRHEQQLTAELSHELRTPLAGITAEVDWLTAHRRTPAEQHASHEAIAAGAARMHHICETLLSEARDDRVPGRCAADDVARELARRGAQEHPEAPPITVRGDTVPVGVSAALTERILTPLLDNARRYAVQGITIECARARVTVADDGPGVPVEVGAAVFEPGRRADPADGHDGAGLGLALARRLARAAGGDITLAETGTGARFVVSLPPG